MRPFDCLSLDASIFGPHLLEASAGTGKTFAIEHIYARLILEGVPVEEILVVTFTRAATRELKMRLRANLEKILSGTACFEYLKPHLGSKQRVFDALACFDRCQIFTIHAFCYRMLKEFAFEASVGALSNPDESKAKPRLKQALYDFLENGISQELLCDEQLTLLIKDFDSLEKLANPDNFLKKFGASLSFSEICAKCKAALHLKNEQNLIEDFWVLAKNYKAAVKGDFEAQVRGLATCDIRPLLKEKGSLFKFLSLENRKVKWTEPKLHYPGYFEEAKKIWPYLTQKVFPVLQKAFLPIAEKILWEEEELSHDELLNQMRRSMENKAFVAAVKKKYQAALIDEFQDTDAVQWEIFQTLFADAKSLF